MRQPKLFPVAIVAVVLIVGCVLFFMGSYGLKAVCPKGSLCIPITVLDATGTIPGTDVTFAYPSKGLYGLGSQITKKTSFIDSNVTVAGLDPNKPIIGKFQMDTMVKSGQDSGLGYFGFSIEVQKRTTNETLEQLVERLQNSKDMGGYVAEYSKYGHIVGLMNGHQFFLYETTEDRDTWTAVSIGKNEIIHVSLGGKRTDTPESGLAFANQRQLLQQLLENISFE